MRLDQFLVEKKWARSRAKAHELIEGGFVKIVKNSVEKYLTKPSFEVKPEDESYIQVEMNPIEKYVSRAGLKIEAAFKKINLDIKDKIILDLGQSTGGFTDFLIQNGAKKVIGIEVGHGQLHKSLKENSRITTIENLNVKHLKQSEAFLKQVPAQGFPLIVADLSFISLVVVVDHITDFLANQGHYLFLVKPQFELTASDLDKNGLVKDKKSYTIVEDKIRNKFQTALGPVSQYFACDVKGKDGNQEYFIFGQKKS